MAFVKEEEINHIRQSSDIVQIISSYIPLNKAGNDYVGICPFHEDHSPSMHVSPKRNIFKCFVCNTGGNVFSFVQKYENVSYLEAVKIVANKSGIDFKYDNSYSPNQKFKKEFDLMDLSLKYYQNNLATSKGIKAKEYLKQRGINEDIIKEFKLGLSLNDNSLKKFLETKDDNLELASSVGILNKDGINYYDTFVDRIMIPIFDMQNNLAGYTARAYLEESKNKYINSKETNIYKKSNIIFNYYNAKDTARLNKEIIIVEGNMDAIMMATNGIKNVIALMGVVISDVQIEALKRLNLKVILMLDNDDAGLLATTKIGDQIIKAGLDTYVVRLNGAKDPDEYIRKFGKDKILDNIKYAKKYIDFKLDLLKDNKNLDNALDLATYLKDIISLTSNMSNLEKDVFLTKISNDYNIDKNILIKNAPLDKTKVKEEVKVLPKKNKSLYEKGVNELLYGLLLNKEYYDLYIQRLGYLKNKMERDVTKLIGSYIKKYNDIDIAGFLDYVASYEDIYTYISNIINESKIDNLQENEFCDILYSVSNIINEEEIQNIQLQIKSEKDIAKKVELIEKLTELKKGSVKDERN